MIIIIGNTQQLNIHNRGYSKSDSLIDNTHDAPTISPIPDPVLDPSAHTLLHNSSNGIQHDAGNDNEI